MSKILLSCFWLLGCSANATQITLDDQHVLICLEYVTSEFVPAPFRGEWQQLYYNPEAGSTAKGSVVSFEFSQGEKNNFLMHQKISKNGTDAILTFTKSIDDWTFGFYNSEKRKDIVEGKYLLDYDKKLAQPPQGVVPKELLITKHAIGHNNKDTIYLVFFQSKDIDLIKKYHRMPIFHEWGKPEGFWYGSIGR